jgi:hypothetical protein
MFHHEGTKVTKAKNDAFDYDFFFVIFVPSW